MWSWSGSAARARLSSACRSINPLLTGKGFFPIMLSQTLCPSAHSLLQAMATAPKNICVNASVTMDNKGSVQMAAFTALRKERVLYVDTVGSFSWGIFSAMYKALPKQSASLAETRSHLDLYRVFTLRNLLQLLHALSHALAEV